MSSIYSGSSLGGSRSSLGSSTGLSGFSPPSYKAPTTVSKPSHHWYDGITGFIGHLGADIEHAVVGLPMGIIQLIRHPIASTETMAKMTWQDWSPLFHGDFATWEHNTYEHPLNPILDVLSVATLGGAVAGRVAEGTAELGLASREGSLARFGNPGKAVLAEHTARKIAEGMSEEDALNAAIKLKERDPRVYRMVQGKGKLHTYTDEYSKNPVIRARQKSLAKIGQKAASTAKGQRIGVDKIMGDQALYKRLQRADKGTRDASMPQVVHRQISALHDLGGALDQMPHEQIYEYTKGTMRDGLEAQAREIPKSAAPLKANGKIDSAEFMKRLNADGMTLIKDRKAVTDEVTMKHLSEGTDESFKKAMESWGHDQTTDGLRDAATSKDGESFLVIPKGQEQMMPTELTNSINVVKLLYKKPTQVWKWMILAASPRYFVNNVIGNWLMMANSIDPVNFSRAMYTHIRLRRGLKAANAATDDVGRAINKITGDRIDKWYGAEHQGFARSQMDERGLAKSGVKAKVAQGFYPITDKVAEQLPRRAAIISTLRRTPEFQQATALYKRQGLSDMAAFNKAVDTASQSAGVRAFVRQQVNHTLGQYHTFTGIEHSIQGIIPFYSWDRAITRHTAELIRSKPYKVAIMSGLSAQGLQKTKDMLGQLPGFLQGVVPEEALGGPAGLLGALFGSGKKGSKNILLTQSLNPYSTVGDIANAGLSAAGLAQGGQGLSLGETVGSQLNPILSGAAESLTGTSLLSGAPIKHSRGGLFGDIANNLIQSLPPVKIGEAVANKYGGGYPQPAKANQPFLYSKDVRSQIGSYLGFGARQMGLDTAHQLARSERGGKKPRKISTGVPGL